MLFWGIIGAYVQAPNFISKLPSSLKQAGMEETVYLRFTSVWYATLIILSLSAIAVGIASILYYQTGTLPYLIRYSKLGASTYFASLYLGNLVASFILEALLTISVVYMFSNNGIGISATPSKLEIIIPTILLSSIFFISFAVFLNLAVIKFNAYRFQNLFNYIPLVLGFLAFSIFTYMTIESPAVYYSNPYMAIQILLYYGYSGSFEFSNATGVVTTLDLSPILLFLSIIAWIVILNVINFILLRKIYYLSIEEGRII